MTDSDEGSVTSTEDGGERPTRPASVTQAASRARRIGGRPQPQGATVPAKDTGSVATEPATKGKTGKAGKAGRSEKAPSSAADADSSTGKTRGPVELTKPRHRGMSAARAATAARHSDTQVAEPKATRTSRARTGRAPWLRWLPAGVAGAAVVALIVIGLIVSNGVWWGASGNDTASKRGQVLAAAKSCMATINTYDYRKLAQAEAAGAACTTGKLTSQYQTAMDKVIKPQATKIQFTQTAQINNAGTESVSKDGKQWVVLIIGQLATTNSSTGTKTPRLDVFSARVTMQQVKGKWLVAAYQYAPST